MSPQSPLPEKAPEPPQPPNKLHEWLAAAGIMMFLSLIAYMFWSFLRSTRL